MGWHAIIWALFDQLLRLYPFVLADIPPRRIQSYSLDAIVSFLAN